MIAGTRGLKDKAGSYHWSVISASAGMSRTVVGNDGVVVSSGHFIILSKLEEVQKSRSKVWGMLLVRSTIVIHHIH